MAKDRTSHRLQTRNKSGKFGRKFTYEEIFQNLVNESQLYKPSKEDEHGEGQDLGEVTWLFGPHGCNSSWLEEYGYLYLHGQSGVAVLFKGGAAVFYYKTTIDDYENLNNASSKGSAIHDVFWNEPYKLISWV